MYFYSGYCEKVDRTCKETERCLMTNSGKAYFNYTCTEIQHSITELGSFIMFFYYRVIKLLIAHAIFYFRYEAFGFYFCL